MKQEKVIEILKKMGSRSITLISNGERIRCSCPLGRWLHTFNDRIPSFYIMAKEGEPNIYHCFGCGIKGGNISSLISTYLKYNPSQIELTKYLDEFATEEIWTSIKGIKMNLDYFKKFDSLPDNNIKEPQTFSEECLKSFLPLPPNYYQARGLTAETVSTFELCYDNIEERIVFPVRDIKKRLVGLIGRSVRDDKLPWYNYWNFKKSQFLYGIHLFDKNIKRMVIVEGAFDVLKLYQYGIKNTFAIMGSSVSEEQLKLITRKGYSIYLFPDGDNAGYRWVEEVHRNLRGKALLLLVEPIKQKDPDDLTKQEVEELLNKAVLLP